MEYLKRDIARIIDRPARTIQYWTDHGVVIPDIVPSTGKGKARVYSHRNLIEFGMVDIMCRQMKMELDVASNILDLIRWGGVGESGFQYGFGQPKGVNLLADFYTSPEWGESKELACMISTNRAFSDEELVPPPVMGFFVITKDEDEFSEKYREWASCKGDSAYLPLARLIIFVGAIKNTALDVFGITLSDG
jgi:hypothetical protein